MKTLCNPFVRELDLFEDIFSPFFGSKQAVGFAVDIEERQDAYVVTADLAGVPKENVNVEYEDGKLQISVTETSQNEDKNQGFIHRERAVRNAKRTIIAKDIDPTAIRATLKDGVLEVTLPKAKQEEKKQRIEIA